MYRINLSIFELYYLEQLNNIPFSYLFMIFRIRGKYISVAYIIIFAANLKIFFIFYILTAIL